VPAYGGVSPSFYSSLSWPITFSNFLHHSPISAISALLDTSTYIITPTIEHFPNISAFIPSTSTYQRHTDPSPAPARRPGNCNSPSGPRPRAATLNHHLGSAHKGTLESFVPPPQPNGTGNRLMASRPAFYPDVKRAQHARVASDMSTLTFNLGEGATTLDATTQTTPPDSPLLGPRSGRRRKARVESSSSSSSSSSEESSEEESVEDRDYGYVRIARQSGGAWGRS